MGSAELFNPRQILETDRVLLRVLQKKDRPALQQLTGDKEIWQFFTSDLSDEKQLQEWVDEALNQFEAGQRVPFVIIDKERDQIIGSTSYGNISPKDKRLEIGFTWLGKSYQGKGYNKHCKYLLLQQAFDFLNFERVEFKTDVLNKQSRGALLKIGAFEEGILRSHTLMPKNRRRDTIYYSLLKEEWNDIKIKNFAGLDYPLV